MRGRRVCPAGAYALGFISGAAAGLCAMGPAGLGAPGRVVPGTVHEPGLRSL